MATDHSPKRLLSLDGGGVRGLASLYILKDLMTRVGGGRGNPVPKPCQYFDLIGGTSTGGLIAIMLGRLEMTVDQCIDAYVRLSRDIFANPKRSKSQSKLVALMGREIGANYDTARFESIIKDLVKEITGSEDTLLKNADAQCKVFVCAINDSISQPMHFKSYYTSETDNLIDSTTIWQACRATSAAKTFFDPAHIQGGKYSDGGMGRNNPVREVWSQAREIWGLSEGQMARFLKCFVSIGTGVPKFPPEAENKLPQMIKLLQTIATDTEDTAEQFVREKAELREAGQYYRFNVIRGLEGIGLDEAASVERIKASSWNYTATSDVKSQAKVCADALAGKICTSF